jgi:tRNA(Ile)-lysidine synthetase-like protein
LAPEADVIVALSGGADSVYLLEVLAAARPRPRLFAVHVEHGLRGADGLEDARFCERLCGARDVPFVLRHLTLDPRGSSLEARAREGRYRVLCEEAARLSIATILTGHHADDALETLLQRWLRGTDLHGLAGLQTRLRLPPRSAPREPAALDAEGRPQAGAPIELAPAARAEPPSGAALVPPGRALRRPPPRAAGERLNPTDFEVEIIRPLIAMRREEVRSSLRERHLEWREDGTNESPRFTRNRLRNLFLPEIERVCGPSAIENLRAFGRAVESLEERCAELTAGIAWDPPLFAAACRGLAEAGLGGTLARERLTELSPTLRRRALWRLIAEGTGRAPGQALLEALMADLAHGRCARHSLSARWSLQLRSRLVHLEPPPRVEANRTPEGALDGVVSAASQLDFAFASQDRAQLVGQDASAAGARLELPGCVALDDGRSIGAEILEVPPATDIPRSPTCVELDAHDLVGPLHVRWPRAGDRFQALGAPGSKALGRFFGDIGLPRRDRARVPLVFAAGELLWVAGIRPGERRRIDHTTQKRLRLTLYPAPEGARATPRGAEREEAHSPAPTRPGRDRSDRQSPAGTAREAAANRRLG